MTAPLLGRRATDTVLPPWVGKFVIGLISVLTLFLFATAWSSKADRADVEQIRFDVQRILDVVCDGKPDARACK